MAIWLQKLSFPAFVSGLTKFILKSIKIRSFSGNDLLQLDKSPTNIVSIEATHFCKKERTKNL